MYSYRGGGSKLVFINIKLVAKKYKAAGGGYKD
jgi:hypothetical protein